MTRVPPFTTNEDETQDNKVITKMAYEPTGTRNTPGETERGALNETMGGGQMSQPGGAGMTQQGMGHGGQGGPNMQRLKNAWQTGSPDEVRDEVRRMVEKGVAAVAGVVRGFSERAKQEKLPETTGNAIREAGDTARSVVRSTGEQASEMSGDLKKSAQEIGQSAREVGQTATEEARKTTSTVGEEARKTKETMKREADSMRGGSGGQSGQSGL